MLNFNVGIMGHVDSGKTSLAKVLSQVASTAAFDKNPQSRERGITLDLGFSSFNIPLPEHLKSSSANEDQMQITLVDCPGHASLIRTIIGGSQIIDMVLLVIDATKGIQTQTAECLVIAEITCDRMIIAVNKVDLLETSRRTYLLEKMKKKLRQTLLKTKFKETPIVGIAANTSAPSGIEELTKELCSSVFMPLRNVDAPFLFAVDHCFAIKGKGTVMTGTILQGKVQTNNVIDIPSLKTEKKVKTMQMFKKPVTSASQGDRLGICVTQFDPKLMERGIVCEPGLAKLIYCAIISVNLIKYFKHAINSKSKFHITIGHETVMASITGFCSKFPVITEIINFEIDYEYLNNLELEETIGQKFAVLEFEKPVLAIEQSLVIASKLDIDVHSSECRIAFWGKLLELCSDKDYKTNYLPKLKIFKIKYKTGTIERMVDDKNVIVKGIFKKETNLDVFMGLSVSFSTGEMGSIVSSFGQTGKIRVCCNSNMPQQTLDILNSKRNKHKSNPSEPIHEDCKPISVNLQFKRYLYDLHKRVTQ